MASIIPRLLLLLQLLLSSTSTSTSDSLHFATSSSSSNTTISITTTTTTSSTTTSSSSSFLGEIISAISTKEGWDADASIRVSAIDSANAKVGSTQAYALRARVGPAPATTGAIARFADDEIKWAAAAAPVVEVDGDGDELVAGGGALGFGSGVSGVELMGPIEIRVRDGREEEKGDGISLQLPSVNTTYTGLKRIIVAEGITIEVVGAEEVSFSHPHDIGLLPNGSLATHLRYHNPTWPLDYPSCTPVLTVHIIGSVVVVAHKTGSPEDNLKSSYKSRGTIELLSDRCYVNGRDQLIAACLFCSVSSRLVLLDNVLTTLFGKRSLRGESSIRFTKARVVSITLVKFRLELEREIIQDDDKLWRKLPKWNTKPNFQHVWLEVVAKVKEGGRLKAVLVKKLRKPFSVFESYAWSSLTSNISFTQFSSLLQPPETFSLDVNW